MGACISGIKQATTVHSEQGITLQDLPLELVHHILNLVWPDKRQPRSSKVEVREWCAYAAVSQTWRRHFRNKPVALKFSNGEVPPVVQDWLATRNPLATVVCEAIPYCWIEVDTAYE